MKYDPKKYWQNRENPNVKGSDRAPQFIYNFAKPLLVGKTKILELGPGTGRILDLYEPHMQVSTVDLSTRYHDQVVKRAEELDLNLEPNYLDGPKDTFPFGDKSFELGMSLQVLMHVTPEDILTTIRELHRTCNAVAIVATSPDAVDSFAPHVFGHNYRSLCEEVGAVVTSYETHKSSVCFTFR